MRKQHEALQVIHGILKDVAPADTSAACYLLDKTHPRSGWYSTAMWFKQKSTNKQQEDLCTSSVASVD